MRRNALRIADLVARRCLLYTSQLTLYEEKSLKGEDYVQLHICVKDNGIGMSPDFLKKIYDSYSRADGARVQKTEGAGLGMAITKYIVDAMQGTIAVSYTHLDVYKRQAYT